MNDRIIRNRLTPERAQSDAAEARSSAELCAFGRDVFLQEARALQQIADLLDESFALTVRWLYSCRGRVLVSGLGKSGNVARKLAATFSSTGTPSIFVHPVDALHGDIGVASPEDLLLLVSRSGQNQELLTLQNSLEALGVRSILISGEMDSPLVRSCDLLLHTPIDREACPLNLTPTTSTTAAQAMGDALAVTLLRLREFQAEDFAVFHPSGLLGRKLKLRVEDLMRSGDELPLVSQQTSLREVLPVLTEKRLGCTCVVDEEGKLVGFLSDGDLKRILQNHDNVLDEPVTRHMSVQPVSVSPDCLAGAALRKMEQNPGGPITQLVVTRDAKPLGIVHIHDILRRGLT